MAIGIKNQAEILQKLKIEELNPMQIAAQQAIHSQSDIVLLSPTGTGKTLAFLLPIIQSLEETVREVQILILVPSRELAIQIEQVTREMGTGCKVNAVYGGRSFSKDKIELQHPPAILIGTPGRVADHFRRETISLGSIETLVLDEFDKSLEVGFELQMREIIEALPAVKKRILTSATQQLAVPDFVGVNKPLTLDFLVDEPVHLEIKTILSPWRDKLDTLLSALCHFGNVPGIVFCNFKDSIQRVSDFLHENGISHGCFYGGMEQKDRERALIQFRNGTHQLIVATDLAARGLDIPEIEFILHYHLPVREHEFIHRNGRTARMNREGTAYILQWVEEDLPDFIPDNEILQILPAPIPEPSPWKTLFISGGRKDKISKGDIAGMCMKQGQLTKDEVGIIEVKQDCAFVAVQAARVEALLPLVDNTRLKKKKVRVSVI